MVTVAVTPTSAAPVPAGPATAQSLAAQNSDALVAGRPAFLHASANETFARDNVVSSGGAQYVSYQRTYSGIPVVGGDFVLVADGTGQVVFTSVALERPIGNLSATPQVSKSAAEAVASGQLRTVTTVEDTRLLVD